METIKYTGKLQRYFQAPIYMIFLFVAGDVLVFLQNIKVGALFSMGCTSRKRFPFQHGA